MKKQWTTSLICSVILMSFSAVAAAQPEDHGHQDHQEQHGNQDQHGRQEHRGHKDHRNYRGMSDRGRSEGWYRRGGRVPSEYRGHSHVVNDWRSDHLREPPRGYHWVRSDNGDFLLVAITSGIITDLLLHH